MIRKGTSMRAVQVSEAGGPEVLRIAEVEEPHAGPGQIRIATRAAGVNPIDWKLRSGAYAVPTPFTPGVEASGVVDEVGDGVSGVAVGDAVFGSASGGYAEHTVLSAWQAKPDALSWEQAAGAVVAAETSERAYRLLGLHSGETVVINGASGGVGTAAVQLAVAKGATVIGVAGPANQDYVRSLGAEAVTYGPGLVERVRAAAPDGVDAAFDVAGSGVIPELIELTGDPSRVVSIADFSSAARLGAKVTSGGGDASAFDVLADVAAAAEAGRYRIELAHVLPLAQAADAHRLSESGHTRGKIVLTV